MALIRKERYPIDFVLKHIKPHIPRHKNIVDFDGDPIELESQRYRLFNSKGTKCVDCGLEAEYFSKEKTDDPRITKFHLNLYGIRDGKEILFTKDHVIPKSKGGKNHMKNYVTMCTTCNGKKADKYDPKLAAKTKQKTKVKTKAPVKSYNVAELNLLIVALLTLSGIGLIWYSAGKLVAFGALSAFFGGFFYKSTSK